MDSSDTGEVLLAVANGGDTAEPVELTTLEAAGLMERKHLQEWIIANPGILGPGIKIITVEYDGFASATGAQKSRLDVLGLDTDGRLVVAELKRGVAPDTVEMQAIKYAAMASRFRLETLAAAHAGFQVSRDTPMSQDAAEEALQAHASVTEESLANPRVVVVAQGFSPIVISSVVWLADRGVDLSLVRFQPYRHADGQVFVTFSRLYPLPDIEKDLLTPLTTTVSSEKLPIVEWSVTDLTALGRVANTVTRTTLDLCSDRPGENVSLTEICAAAEVERPTARGHLARLTSVVKGRFHRRNWPFDLAWAADGTQQAFYRMDAEAASRWQEAAKQLDLEQSDVQPDEVGAVSEQPS